MPFYHKFSRCESGAVFILVGLSLLLLLTVTIMVIDAGRLYTVQSKAQNASDAALLGAVSTAGAIPIEGEVQRLFTANYPDGYMNSEVGNITVTSRQGDLNDPRTRDKTIYEVEFNVAVPTHTLGYILGDNVDIRIFSQVMRGPDRKLEVSIVLDNSDSMTGSKMDALKVASRDLVNILFGDTDTSSNLFISMVPYDMVVNIGTGRAGWIQSGDSLIKYNRLGRGNCNETRTRVGFAYNRETDYVCGRNLDSTSNSCINGIRQGCTPGSYEDCNIETGVCTIRNEDCTCTPSPPSLQKYNLNCTANGLNDISDLPPTSEATRFRLPMEKTCPESDVLLPNTVGSTATICKFGNCSRWAQHLKPMIFGANNKGDLHNVIDIMETSGGTRINVGLMWGWFTLSPKWKGIWDAAKPDLPGESTDTVKIEKSLVLMTDGKNIFSGDDAKTQQLCDAVKAQGITIYTVGFGNGADINEGLLQACASQATYYFHAPTEADLRRSFQQIADSILYPTIQLSQ